MTRPNASDDESSKRRLVTKPEVSTEQATRLTFCSASEVACLCADEVPEEDRQGAYDEAEAAPRPFDDALFCHAVPYASAEYPVGVLNERKVSTLDDILLKLLAVVECDFFRVLQQPGVGEAQLAFEVGFVGCVFAEWGRDCAHWGQKREQQL